jgi:hypothetical protein
VVKNPIYLLSQRQVSHSTSIALNDVGISSRVLFSLNQHRFLVVVVQKTCAVLLHRRNPNWNVVPSRGSASPTRSCWDCMSLAACRHLSLLKNGTNMTQRCLRMSLSLLGSRVRVIGGVCGRINRNARRVRSNGGIVINLETLGLLSTWKRSARLAAKPA